MSGIIKVIVNDEYIEKEASVFTADIQNHILQHIQILLEESFRYNVSEEDRIRIVSIFVNSFSKTLDGILKDVFVKGTDYVRDRMVGEHVKLETI